MAGLRFSPHATFILPDSVRVQQNRQTKPEHHGYHDRGRASDHYKFNSTLRSIHIG